MKDSVLPQSDAFTRRVRGWARSPGANGDLVRRFSEFTAPDQSARASTPPELPIGGRGGIQREGVSSQAAMLGRLSIHTQWEWMCSWSGHDLTPWGPPEEPMAS